MADNVPAPERTTPPPLPSPGSGSPSVRPPPLPSASVPTKTPAGKVVLLSSVAKAPPVVAQPIASTPGTAAIVKDAPTRPPLQVKPTPVSVKPADGGKLARPGGGGLEAKASPQPATSRWPTFSGAPVGLPPETPASPLSGNPPPLPASASPEAPRKALVKPTSTRPKPSVDALFAEQPEPEPAPKGWAELQPGELEAVAGDMESMEVFARSQKILSKPTPVLPLPAPEEKPIAKSTETTTPASPQPLVILPPVAPLPDSALHPATVLSAPPASTAPPSLVILPPVAPVPDATSAVLHPPIVLAAPAPVAHETEVTKAPALLSGAHVEKSGEHPLHVAPPLVVSEPAPHVEKLRQPQLPGETAKEDNVAAAKAPVLPAPEPETKPPLAPLVTIPAKGLSPVPEVKRTSRVSKVTGPITRKEKGGPIILAPLALKPAVLPSKMQASLKEAEAVATPAPVAPLPKPTVVASPPVTPAPVSGQAAAKAPAKADAKPPIVLPEKAPLPPTRAARAKKRRLIEALVFYVTLILTGVALFYGGIYFCRETRVEGQVIPPTGLPLNSEVWIVTDFRTLASGISEDVAAERGPLLQEIQERQEHVQRVQADIALREERMRLLNGQIQSAKDDEVALVKNSRDATQKIWDGEGVRLDDEYDSRLNALQRAIADRAKANKLDYQPDDTYHSPEVWANAYRLALYQVPAGVDSAKEYVWLSAQMKQWRDLVKSLDAQKEQLREQAAQIKLAPGGKIADLNAKIDELQHRIDTTEAEEDPLKAELQQAQVDLGASQTEEAGLDDKYYKQLDTLPEENIIKHIPLAPNGRFTWVEDDNSFAAGQKEHRYWIFARATRPDGRQFWALGHFTVEKDSTLGLIMDPDGFVSTKSILRPDLSPDEQAQ